MFTQADPEESAKAAALLASAKENAASDDMDQFSDEVAVSAQVNRCP